MSRRLYLVFSSAVVISIWIWFTRNGLASYFSGDDLMNMYKAWATPALKIWKGQLLPWMPQLRPLGAAVYRVSYSLFGFEPRPAQDEDRAVDGQGGPHLGYAALGQPGMLLLQENLETLGELAIVQFPGPVALELPV